MKAIVTGGGTAGHINPALAIAEQLRLQRPDTEILYVGTARGLESDLAPRAGHRFEAISVQGFKRKLSVDTLRSAGKLVCGLGQAWSLLVRERPDVVIGTGGYVCGPVVFLAALRGIPTLIHEQNVFPGATNRILSRFVDSVCVAYEDSRSAFSRAKRIAVVGNPVKRDFAGLDRAQCRAALGIDGDTPFIVSLGGSGGAARINQAVQGVLEQLPGGMRWTHITGKNYFPQFEAGFPAEKRPPGVAVLPFSYEMPLLMGAADLVVGRSGALTLAELATAGVPAVLIPSPHVANDHQTHNAEACRKLGMAEIIPDSQLTAERLWQVVETILAEPGRLQAMRDACKGNSMEDSSARIAEEVWGILKAGRS